jgi:hypothetical protein
MPLKVVPKGQNIQGTGAAGNPGLAEIYRAAGLPPVPRPDQLPKGEQQMLDDRKLRQFVNDPYLPPATRRKRQRVSTTSATVKSGRPTGRPT